jgi:L-aspartate oxidase
MDKIIIVGGGLAGLFAALKLAPLPVSVITPRPLGEGASSAWAQAGIAAAIGEGDSFEKHASDTIAAGAGLCDARIVDLVVREAPAAIDDLLRFGVPFDRDLEGKLKASREAAHSARRVIGVRGDQAGKAIMAALIASARRAPHITVLENRLALELHIEASRVTGVWCASAASEGAAPVLIRGRAVVLATGGIGQLYQVTTNPAEARGQGLAMAARAGALIADPEFVQFHPTALDVGRSPAPLATEALRGEGAVLVNRRGERFMEGVHPALELAPRDIVARAVERERLAGRGAFLDCRGALGEAMAAHFPAVHAACAAAGLDPARDLIPVAAAAHYHMGGIATDENARTSLPGLWAVGECASTGLHGANRLASNSLLEAVVMAARAACDIAAREAAPLRHAHDVPPRGVHAAKVSSPAADVARLKAAMSAQCGPYRTGDGLDDVMDLVGRMLHSPAHELASMAQASLLVAAAAGMRTESRGAHYRSDYPQADPRQARRSVLTLAEALRWAKGRAEPARKRALGA